MENERSGDGTPRYGYAVVPDGADETHEPLHEEPFERLDDARSFAVGWLADRDAAARLAVVRLYLETGRRDTVAIVDPTAADVRSELDRRRSTSA